MTKRTVALLPMKANSERVKGKNFKNLEGQPLFTWILNELLSSSKVDLVVINTDAPQILDNLDLLNNKKILIRERKQELQGDLVSMNLILQDDIQNVDAETYIMTHTTNPLIKSKTIEKALDTYQSNLGEYDSLFSVTKVQSRFYREDLTPVNHEPSKLIRTQDLEPWFEENSCIFVFSRESFEKTNARIGLTPLIFETPSLESIDIDEPNDWYLASALMSKRLEEDRNK